MARTAPDRADPIPSDSYVLDMFENILSDFIVERLSAVPNWEKVCLPLDIRKDAKERYEREKKMGNVLNKPTYPMFKYINFDAYERIVTRKDNWRNHFESVFVIRAIFSDKMAKIQSLRNDIRHGRQLNHVNRLRLRLHCYDLISQVYEQQRPNFRRRTLEKKMGLVP